MEIDQLDKKTVIAALTFVVNHLDDGTEKFAGECVELRKKLELHKP